MKQIAILGSTGSIGQNTLDVVRSFPRHFRIVAISADSNTGILCRQIKEFKPSFAYVNNPMAALRLGRLIKSSRTKILTGREGIKRLFSDKRIDTVVLAISGSNALLPLLEAIENGKNIALANKEALVMAGPIIMERARKKKVKIIPIDSEQSAIWQCLDGRDRTRLKSVYLTASGGPFRKTALNKLKKVSVKEVLKHPRWKMGKKISVDSATLMNKGLELLEAMYLFGLKPKNVKIIIHPEAVVHSMVEFIDGSILAQLSATDMRIPIQYALSYPERLATSLSGVDLYKPGGLNFQRPDFKKFPCLKLSYEVAAMQGTAPCVFNAANEAAVGAFLKGALKFLSIPFVIRKVLRKHCFIRNPNLEDILEADKWARQESAEIIRRLN